VDYADNRVRRLVRRKSDLRELRQEI
jgi:hypothetical protein